jgi:hypothetical protein
LLLGFIAITVSTDPFLSSIKHETHQVFSSLLRISVHGSDSFFRRLHMVDNEQQWFVHGGDELVTVIACRWAWQWGQGDFR